MKRLILKKVPDEEVSQLFLKMRTKPPDETPLVVPKVIRQYTRKKKDLKTEPVSEFVAPTVSSTFSVKTCPEFKTDTVKIKEENVNESNIYNTMFNSDQNCMYSKMADPVKIKEEVCDEIETINQSNCNVNEKVVHHDLKDAMSLQMESIRVKPDIEIQCNSPTSVKTSPKQNGESIIDSANKTVLTEEIQIKEEIDNSMYGNFDPVIINIKQEPVEETKPENILNQTKRVVGNGGLKTIVVKKCKFVRADFAPTKPPKVGIRKYRNSCDICGHQFISRAHIRYHISRKHRAQSKYACTLCPWRFHYYFQLMRHLRRHNGRPLVCDLCPKSFALSRSYASHMNSHLREKLYSCPVCLSRFTSSVELHRHVVRHTRTDSFDCSVCAAKFPLASKLNRHRDLEHGERRMYPCYLCTRTLDSETELADHLRGHTDPLFECAFCERLFIDARHWESHSAEHIAALPATPRGQEPHVCDVCHKTFTYKSTMITHLASHKADRPFSCGKCMRTYKTRSALSGHEKSHGRPFACDTCGARFGKGDTLARHLLIHTGERPHTCEHCKASFGQKSALSQHIQRIHMPTLKRAPIVRKTKTGRRCKSKS